MLLRGGYVRELAAASYPHIHGGAVIFLRLQVARLARTDFDVEIMVTAAR